MKYRRSWVLEMRETKEGLPVVALIYPTAHEAKCAGKRICRQRPEQGLIPVVGPTVVPMLEMMKSKVVSRDMRNTTRLQMEQGEAFAVFVRGRLEIKWWN